MRIKSNKKIINRRATVQYNFVHMKKMSYKHVYRRVLKTVIKTNNRINIKRSSIIINKIIKNHKC